MVEFGFHRKREERPLEEGRKKVLFLRIFFLLEGQY